MRCLVMVAITAALLAMLSCGAKPQTELAKDSKPDPTKVYEDYVAADAEVAAIWERLKTSVTPKDWARAKEIMQHPVYGQGAVLLVAHCGRKEPKYFAEADELIQRKVQEPGIPNRPRWLEAYAYLLGLPGPPDEPAAFQKAEAILDEGSFYVQDSYELKTNVSEFVESQFASNSFGRKLSTMWILHFSVREPESKDWSMAFVDSELKKVRNLKERKFWTLAKKMLAQAFI